MPYLGILEDHRLQHVPGTVRLNEQTTSVEAAAEATVGLKHGTGKDADIVLVPQPSEDPNDPLNWSTSKKLTIMAIISFGSILYAAVLAPLLSPALVLIALDYKVPIADITVISGYMLLVAGSSGPIICALSRKYGKRPFLILSSLLGLIGTIVGSSVNSYDGLLAARIIQGGSISAFESLVVSMIGDLWFVHQRGVWMTLIQFIMGAASNFSAIIVGPIATDLGWRYLFHILLAFVAVETILVILFVPETQYIRDRRYEIDELADDKLSELAAAEHRHAALGTGSPTSSEKDVDTAKAAAVTKVETRTTTPPSQIPKKTFVQELAIFNTTYTSDNLLQLFIAPFAVCLNLSVLWMILITGTLTAFMVAQSYDMAQIFMAPPYLLSAAGVGYLSLGPFIGGVIASLLLGATLDPMIKWCAKRNGGVYEPEYRLLGMTWGLLSGVGLFAFGYLAQNGKSYYLTSFAHGIGLFGIVAANIAAAAYAIDAFRDMSSEVFIANMVFKNFLFYGFSYFVNDWTAESGADTIFYVFGGISFVLVGTTPIVYIFGKRYRSFWYRWNILGKLGVRTHEE